MATNNPICTMQDNRDNMKFDDTDLITRELYAIACNPMIPREYRTEILKDYQTERKAKVILPGWGGVSVKDYIDDLVWDKGCDIERDGFHYHLRSKNGADFYQPSIRRTLLVNLIPHLTIVYY